MKRALKPALLGFIALVFGYAAFKYSLYLAAVRLYHADECQNVFMARVLATGQAEAFTTSVSLYLVPLMWLARSATQSVDLFTLARVVSLLLFWLNLLLIALATGERLSSRRWMVAFFGAATLAPLWDFGFEIRPDNLLLTTLLLTWCAVRTGRGGPQSYAIAGALAVAMQFITIKALVYTLPLTIIFLLFPPFGTRVPRWKLTLAWVAGGLGILVVIRLAYGAAGIWDTYLAGLQWVWEASADGHHFAPWKVLRRLLIQTPLLLALLLAALLAGFLDWRKRGRAALNWEGNLPETLLFFIAFTALIVNPTTYPYSVASLVPFAFLLAFRYATTVSKELWTQPVLRPIVIAVLIFAHLVPFVIATRRHQERLNFRQTGLIGLAENLTDPGKDGVYDGVGMVPTRASVHFQWLLPGVNVGQFKNGSGARVREMLARQPASVVIPNYRTDWLAEADHEFLREHYVPLADDFWVLGTMLPPGGGVFEVIHPGRYQITTKEASCVLGTVEISPVGFVIPPTKTNCVGSLDGVALTGKPVDLTVGTHRIETASDCEPAVVWIGPRLARLRPLGDSDHLQLFVNWY